MLLPTLKILISTKKLEIEKLCKAVTIFKKAVGWTVKQFTTINSTVITFER